MFLRHRRTLQENFSAMTKNLRTADTIAKLVLSASTVVFFFAGVIGGPFARFLVILSFVTLGIFIVRLISGRLKLRDRQV
jgi:hypothetical protein